MKIISLTPELLVDDIHASIDFYCQQLSFKLVEAFPQKEPTFARLSNGHIQLMLYHRIEFAQEIKEFADQPTQSTIALYLQVDQIKKVYDQLKKIATITQALHKTNYDSQEFACKDPSGYTLILSQT